MKGNYGATASRWASQKGKAKERTSMGVSLARNGHRWQTPSAHPCHWSGRRVSHGTRSSSTHPTTENQNQPRISPWISFAHVLQTARALLSERVGERQQDKENPGELPRLHFTVDFTAMGMRIHSQDQTRSSRGVVAVTSSGRRQ